MEATRLIPHQIRRKILCALHSPYRARDRRDRAIAPLRRSAVRVILRRYPVLVGRSPCYLGSSSRSAILRGVLVGKGVGVLLVRAILARKDREGVTSNIVLTVTLTNRLCAWLFWKPIRA